MHFETKGAAQLQGSLRARWREKVGNTRTILGEKVREALASVLPITAIVLVLCFTISPVPTDTLLAFLMGAVLLIVGMGLFTLGAEMAMTPIGERVGAQMTRSRKLWVVVAVSFLIGVVVTISEPDLQVLAEQVPSVPGPVLMGAVAVGVGAFLVVALLRILFRVPLNGLLIASYLVVFTLACFVPKDFLALAFDSGGVTTGPMTVPFIMALGVGVSSIRSDENAAQDSFGLVALCSVGPILAVLILSLVYPASGTYVPAEVAAAADSRALWGFFLGAFPEYVVEVVVCLAPIAVFFAAFQVASLHMSRKKVLKIVVGLLYTGLGLAVFLTGVNVGFLPAGTYLGQQIAKLQWNWILVPIGMLMGWYIVQAEPAVHVLNHQVEEITSGAIPGGAMSASLSIGVAASKFGRKRTIQAGVILLAACFAAGFFMTRSSRTITAPMYVTFALVGLAWAAINVNSLPMVVEMCKGSDVGKFTGYYYTASMAAQVITPVLAGTLMKEISYQILFPYAAFFVAMSFVTMLLVKHGDSRAEVKTGLDAFEDMDD